MKLTLSRVLLLVVLALFSSCELFEIHPYSGNIKGKRNINTSNIAIIEDLYADKDSIRYAFISDSQRSYDQLESFVKHVNARDDIDFIIHGGDVTDFALTDEFILQRDILEKLIKPYVVVIGNHDCLANGEDIFEIVFGPLNFSFIAGKTKFLGLNTNALESNYSNPIPDFAFIRAEREKDLDRFNQTVVLMHAKPTNEQFNNNVADVFQYSITQYPHLLYCNNGHEHQYQQVDVFDDGITYYGTPNIKKREYLVFSITPGEYTHELQSF